MRVLIVSTSTTQDWVTCGVHEALLSRGAEVLVLRTDEYPQSVGLAFEGSRARLHTKEFRIDLEECDAIWNHRWGPGRMLQDLVPHELADASRRAAHDALCSALDGTVAFHLDRLENIRTAEMKPLQIVRAERCGLSVPRTVVANDSHEVQSFAKTCPRGVVAKTLCSQGSIAGRDLWMPTTLLSEEELSSLTGLHLCPMIFQENVEKLLEVRVAVIGGRAVAAALDSQVLPMARIDWRCEEEALQADWKPHELPREIERAVVRLVESYGLGYSALDLILTPDRRYVFLEINPVGFCGPRLPVVEPIAELLIQGGRLHRRASRSRGVA